MSLIKWLISVVRKKSFWEKSFNQQRVINKLKKGDMNLVKIKDHFKIRENNPFELKKLYF
jgi:hypothetical protein